MNQMNERTYKDYNKPDGYYCKLCDKQFKDRSNCLNIIKQISTSIT